MTVFDRIVQLRREGQPFVVATVVGRRPPVSALLGDRAIVFPDGRMEGFVGGACARDIVRLQALEALRARRARLVSIRPDAVVSATEEHVTVRMTCASEGAVEVYVEPYLRARRLVVVGATPVADALMRLGRELSWDVARVVDAREVDDVAPAASAVSAAVLSLEAIGSALTGAGADIAVVVATQGHYDEEALEAALRVGAMYVGLVASKKRGAAVRTYLDGRGVPGVDGLRSPAGLDLRTRLPAEVALSILAEIIQQSPGQVATPVVAFDAAQAHAPAAGAGVVSVGTAVDPVCGMAVVIETARHTAEHDGRTFYFCCPHCRADFIKTPASYLTS